MTTKITCPKVNINGTSRDSLRDDLLATYTAIREARDTLMRGAPHARDYAQGPGENTYPAALAQYERRLRILTLLGDEITTEAMGLDDDVHEVEAKEGT